MLDTFKVRLKAKYPGVNLSTKRLDAIADRLHKKFPDLTDEADHDQKLDDLNELQPFDELAKQDDRLRTLENKPKEKEEPKREDPPTEGKPKEPRPEWLQLILDQNAALAERLNGIEREKSQTTISKKIDDLAKEKKIPASYYQKRKMPEKEEDIQSFIDEAATDYEVMRQELKDEGFQQSKRPPLGNPESDGNDKISPMMRDHLERQKQVEETKK